MSATCDAERTVTIANRHGLHARPAAEFVKLAATFQSEVMVRKDELDVNGKSIMGMMMLAAEFGTNITIRATGDDAEQAVEGLAALVTTRFGEDG
jgi:phosphocarrier protein HPr